MATADRILAATDGANNMGTAAVHVFAFFSSSGSSMTTGRGGGGGGSGGTYAGTSRPQNLQTTASIKIISAQNGHFLSSRLSADKGCGRFSDSGFPRVWIRLSA